MLLIWLWKRIKPIFMDGSLFGLQQQIQYYFFSYCCTLPRVFCISRSFRRWLRSMLQYSLLCFLLFILVIWLGAEYEGYHVSKLPDTTQFYNVQSIVCAFHEQPQQSKSSRLSSSTSSTTSAVTTNGHDHNYTNNNTTTTTVQQQQNSAHLVFQTFSSVEEARQSRSTDNNNSLVVAHEGTNDSHAIMIDDSNTTETSDTNENNNSVTIAHCGSCGSCSNVHDMTIYDDTKNTLFGYTTHCAKRALIWGRKTATNCMDDYVGFTTDCNDCWVENIMCDLKYCVFTCMWYGLFVQTVDGTKALNACTMCDEKRCGPQFITCAGSNRRRSGIVSDIERDTELEVCTKMKKEWWKEYN